MAATGAVGCGVSIDLVAAVLGPEFGLINGGFDLHGINLADEQFLRHHARAFGPESAEYGLHFAIGQHRVGDVIIKLPEPLVGKAKENSELPDLIEHAGDGRRDEVLKLIEV